MKKNVYLTVVLPCYNEEAILEDTLVKVQLYLEERKTRWDYEILIINDGSKDKTGMIADDFAGRNSFVRVIHHPSNLNLGQALQTGFKNALGSVIVVLDVDLSYSVDLIEPLVTTLEKKGADIVLASPYMPGGKTTAIPAGRRYMSLILNKFMRIAAQDKYHTYTSMVRAYRSSYIKHLNLKTRDYEINPEILYKSMILRANIVEIPAHLDWTEQNKYKGRRTSNMVVLRGFFSGIMSSFIFRPYVFFLVIGTALMALSLFELTWLLVDTLSDLARDTAPATEKSFSISLARQFTRHPHTFIVGGVTFLAAIQFLSLGFLSLQSKRYFEELFHMGTSVLKTTRKKFTENEVY